jgi:hypothetical protein
MENLKKASDLLPLMAVTLIVLGFLDIHTYYSKFDIETECDSENN